MLAALPFLSGSSTLPRRFFSLASLFLLCFFSASPLRSLRLCVIVSLSFLVPHHFPWIGSVTTLMFCIPACFIASTTAAKLPNGTVWSQRINTARFA